MLQAFPLIRSVQISDPAAPPGWVAEADHIHKALAKAIKMKRYVHVGGTEALITKDGAIDLRHSAGMISRLEHVVETGSNTLTVVTNATPAAKYLEKVLPDFPGAEACAFFNHLADELELIAIVLIKPNSYTALFDNHSILAPHQVRDLQAK